MAEPYDYTDTRSMSCHPALPVSLYVADRTCVVVGDGDPAARRAERLAERGARVTTVAADAFTEAAVAGAFLVVIDGVTDDAVAERAARAARAAGALVHAADRIALSDLAMPAVARRGPLQLAVSTDAVAPALSRRLREQLDRALAAAGDRLDALITELQAQRASLPREGRSAALYRIASRLRVPGFEVDDA